MSEVLERGAIGGVLSSVNLATAGLLPNQVSWPNHEFDKDKDKPWLRVSIQHGMAFLVEIGRTGTAVTERCPGTLFLQLAVPDNTGDLDARTKCDVLAALFRGKTINFLNGSLKFRTPTVRDVGPSDGYYMFTVSVPFIRDEVH